MPRPAAQRAKSRGTASKLIADANQLSSTVAVAILNLNGQSNALSNPTVQASLFSLCGSLQMASSGEGGPSPESVKQLTMSTEILPTLTSLLRSVTPALLGDNSASIGDASCNDPACQDGACGPPAITTVLYIAFCDCVSMMLSCEDDEVRAGGYSKLIDSQLVGSIFHQHVTAHPLARPQFLVLLIPGPPFVTPPPDMTSQADMCPCCHSPPSDVTNQADTLVGLIDVAAALLRGSPHDPDAIASADHSLAMVIDCSLQYILEW